MAKLWAKHQVLFEKFEDGGNSAGLRNSTGGLFSFQTLTLKSMKDQVFVMLFSFQISKEQAGIKMSTAN